MTKAVPKEILSEIRDAQKAGDVDGLHKLQKAAFEAMLDRTGKRMHVVGGMPTEIAQAKPSPALYVNRPPRRKELRLAAEPPAPAADEQDIVVKSETPGRPDVVVKRRRSAAKPAEDAARPEPASAGERDIKPSKPAEGAARPSNGRPAATEADLTDTQPGTPSSKSGARPTKRR